jgi:hypothetical protein
MLTRSLAFGCDDHHGHDSQSDPAQSACVCICPCHDLLTKSELPAPVPVPLSVTQKFMMFNESFPTLMLVSGIDQPPEK